MADEHPKQIDETLKAYAEARRKAFDPAVPPALRQAVHREVTLAHGPKKSLSFGALLKKFWPQFGVAVAASLVMATSLVLYETKLQQKQLATSKSYQAEPESFNTAQQTQTATIPHAPAPASKQRDLGVSRLPQVSRAQTEAPETIKSSPPAPPSSARAAPTPPATRMEQPKREERFARGNPAPVTPARKGETGAAAPQEPSPPARLTDARQKAASAPLQKATTPALAASSPARSMPAGRQESRAAAAITNNSITDGDSSLQSPATTTNQLLYSFRAMNDRSQEEVQKSVVDLAVISEANEPSLDLSGRQEKAQAVLSNYYAEQLGAKTSSRSFYDVQLGPTAAFVNSAAAPESKILQTFSFVATHPVIKLIDKDGSVYTGNVINATSAASLRSRGGGAENNSLTFITGERKDQNVMAEAETIEAAVPFFAQGHSQTLNQPVQITGELLRGVTIYSIATNQQNRARKMMSPREATSKPAGSAHIQLQQTNRSSSIIMSGVIQVGKTNRFPLKATSEIKP
ncbi:MAG: hypothetical protein ACO1QB_11500 [Verrucomicrobiales bacterium]